MQSKFDDVAQALVSAIAQGATLVDACLKADVSPQTARNWLANGRRDPEGRYGAFATAIDAAREAAKSARSARPKEMGRVERTVADIVGREFDEQSRVAAAMAQALAVVVDDLAGRHSASATAALAAVSKRLEELVASLRVQLPDRVTELAERRRARLAATAGADANDEAARAPGRWLVASSVSAGNGPGPS